MWLLPCLQGLCCNILVTSTYLNILLGSNVTFSGKKLQEIVLISCEEIKQILWFSVDKISVILQSEMKCGSIHLLCFIKVNHVVQIDEYIWFCINRSFNAVLDRHMSNVATHPPTPNTTMIKRKGHALHFWTIEICFKAIISYSVLVPVPRG